MLVPCAVLAVVMVYLPMSKGQCLISGARCFGEFNEW